MNEICRDSGVENDQGEKGLVQRKKKNMTGSQRLGKRNPDVQASPLPLGLALCTDIA